MSDTERVNDAGWRGFDNEGRQQCMTCGKWQFPVIHSCSGIPRTVIAEPIGIRPDGSADPRVEKGADAITAMGLVPRQWAWEFSDAVLRAVAAMPASERSR